MAEWLSGSRPVNEQRHAQTVVVVSAQGQVKTTIIGDKYTLP